MKKVKKAAVYSGAVAFWVVLWWALSALANRNLLIKIPTPPSVLKTFFSLTVTPRFLSAAAASLVRVLLGFLLAAFFGALLGILSHRVKLASALFSPFLQLIRAVPVASFIFIVFLWLKRDAIPVLTVFLIALPIIAANVESGFSAVDKSLTEMAEVFGFSRKKVFSDITVPALLPAFSSALVTSLGFGFKAGVAAEIICRPELSVGNLLWSAKALLDYDTVFALTLAIVIFSAVLEFVIKKAVAKIGKP